MARKVNPTTGKGIVLWVQCFTKDPKQISECDWRPMKHHSITQAVYDYAGSLTRWKLGFSCKVFGYSKFCGYPGMPEVHRGEYMVKKNRVLFQDGFGCEFLGPPSPWRHDAMPIDCGPLIEAGPGCQKPMIDKAPGRAAINVDKSPLLPLINKSRGLVKLTHQERQQFQVAWIDQVFGSQARHLNQVRGL